MEGGKLENARAKEYILAGDAVLTFRNSETGNRFTYRISRPKDADEKCPHFVKARTGSGSDNGQYAYFANIWPDEKRGLKGLQHGRRSQLTYDDLSVQAFAWIWDHIDDLPDSIEVWHEGRCLRCGRQLTVPESIAQGYGPECIQRTGKNKWLNHGNA